MFAKVWAVVVLILVLLNGKVERVLGGYTKNEYELDYVPTALAGYDVVEYFRKGEDRCYARLGDPEIFYDFASMDQNGVYRLYRFQFVTEENKGKFMCDPWHYAPRFGGFCSWGP